jgi:hypothetical protein
MNGIVALRVPKDWCLELHSSGMWRHVTWSIDINGS